MYASVCQYRLVNLCLVRTHLIDQDNRNQSLPMFDSCFVDEPPDIFVSWVESAIGWLGQLAIIEQLHFYV